MLELRLPLDYEQLPELWQLRSILTKHLAVGDLAETNSKASPKQIEQVASFIFHRLFVTLGYLARSTNQPGLLTKTGAEQFLASLEPSFGDDCNPVRLLEEVNLLAPQAEGWHCQLFASMNAHLSGDYKPGHVRGNKNSRISAAHKRIVAEASMQGSLLPDEIFKKRDGHPMNDTECKRCITIIRMLDRLLGIEFRQPYGFTPGMMASACAVTEAHDPEALRQFYFWIGDNLGRPIIPNTTEQMLERFEEVFPLSKS